MSDDGDSADDRLYGFGPEDYIRFPTLNEQEVDLWALRFKTSTECTSCGEDMDPDEIWFTIDYYDPFSERAHCTSCWYEFWKEEGRCCQACESNGDNSPAVTSLALCARHVDGNSFEKGCGICESDGFVQSFPDECCNGMLGACPTCQSLYDGAEPHEKRSDEDEKQAISARRVQQERERTRRAHQDAATKGAIAPYRPAAQATRAPRDETAPHENRARNMRDSERHTRATALTTSSTTTSWGGSTAATVARSPRAQSAGGHSCTSARAASTNGPRHSRPTSKG